MIRAILPEIGLVVLALIVLLYDLVWQGEKKRSLGWLTAGGIAIVFLITVVFSRPGEESELIWGGMLRHDWLGFSFTLLFLFGAAVTCLFAMEMKELGHRGEFYLLLLTSTLGMILMASSADLVMLFLAIETTSIPLYIMAGFYKEDKKSTEAGFKYFLFGAMTSAVMLYGFSLIYGFTGTTDLYEITEMVVTGDVSLTLAIGTLILVMVGFGFKISVVPFHFWAPDVYEGAPHASGRFSLVSFQGRWFCSPDAGPFDRLRRSSGDPLLGDHCCRAFGILNDTWQHISHPTEKY